jgi:hypothetical protein
LSDFFGNAIKQLASEIAEILICASPCPCWITILYTLIQNHRH